MRVKKHSAGQGVVPPPPWLKAVAWRTSRRERTADEVVAWTESRHLAGMISIDKNENKNSQQRHRHSYENIRERNPAASEILPHIKNPAPLSTPNEGSRGSMQRSPTQDGGAGIGGGGRRSRSLESQPRSRPVKHPLQSHPGGALTTGGVEPPSDGTGAAEELDGREPDPSVGISDRWQHSTRGEHDNRWARRWHEDGVDQARKGVAYPVAARHRPRLPLGSQLQ